MKDLTDWLQVGIGVVALIVTGVLFLIDRRRKSLQWVIIANRAVLTETKFDVEVRHDGKVVRAPRLIVWRVANGGADPIAATDFESPLTFRIDGATILSSDVTHKRPSDLSMSLDHVDGGHVALEQRLMNSFDLVEVQMLVDGDPTLLTVEGRVAGVSRIERGKVPETSWGTPWRFSRFDKVMVWVAGIIFVGIGGWFYLAGDSWILRSIGIAILVFAIGVNPWWIWRRNRNNRLFLGD